MKRKRYSRKFQRMAVERMRTCEHVGELARELGVRPRCLYKWRAKLEAIEPGEEASRPSTHTASYRKEIQQLKRLLAEKTLEVDFFKGALHGPESLTPLEAEYIGADQLPLFVFRLQLCGGPYIPIRGLIATWRDRCWSYLTNRLDRMYLRNRACMYVPSAHQPPKTMIQTTIVISMTPTPRSFEIENPLC